MNFLFNFTFFLASFRGNLLNALLIQSCLSLKYRFPWNWRTHHRTCKNMFDPVETCSITFDLVRACSGEFGKWPTASCLLFLSVSFISLPVQTSDSSSLLFSGE